MKRFSEQLHTKATSVQLRSVEREELRSRVVSYMEYHPIKNTTTESFVTSSRLKLLETDAFQAIQIPASLLFRASALFTMALLIVVPVLAEETVPGDSLYAVKVRFNEEVRSTLTFTPYQKIEWETERLNRRVAEAKLLASEGRLTEDVEVEIAAAVREHTTEVQKEIEELRTEDADQAILASIELSTTLELQSAALQEGGTTVLATTIGSIASDNTAQRVVDVINESLTSQESQVEAAGIPAFDKIMARVQQNTTRAFELLEATNLTPDSRIHQDITRRLEDVSRSVESAKTERTQNEQAASEHLVLALERTQKLIVFMSDIEGNRKLAVDSIVPVVLTPEEQQDLLAGLGAEIERKSAILSLAREKVAPGTAEKITYAVELVASRNVIADTASSTPEATLLHLKEGVAILDDALRIIAAEGVDITTSTSVTPEPVSTTTASTTSIE